MAVIGLTTAALSIAIIGCDNNKSNRRTSSNSSSNNSSASSDRSSSGSSNHSVFNAGRLSPDELFVNQTTQDSLSEIELGRLALDRSNNQQVRALAQRLIDDHNRAIEQLRPIANGMGMTLPTRQAEMHLQLTQVLSGLRGSEFDREFIGHMVSDHAGLVAQLQDKANSARNLQLRQFASTQLPIVRDHLMQAQNIQQQLQSGNTGTGAGANSNSTSSTGGGMLDMGTSTLGGSGNPTSR